MKSIKKYLILILISGFLFSACEKEVSVSTDERKPDNLAKMFVDSKPAGAKIYLNDKNTGYITPDTVKWIVPGEYKLTLKKEYYKDTNVVVSVDLNSVPSKYLDYTTNPNMLGTLAISTDPLGVSILINDSLTNLRTPYKLTKMLPGLYTIGLRLNNYWDGYQQIVIKSQRDSYINYKMKDTTLWVAYNTSNSGIPTDELTSLAIDNNGIKWMGTWGLGLIRFDEKEWKLFDVSNSQICSNYINKIEIAPDNSLWIGTDRGLSIFDGTTWKTYNTANSMLPNNEVLSFGFDSFGRSYIGTGGGLVIIENNVWAIFNSSNSQLPASKIASIAISASTNEVWLASYTGGVARIYNKKDWKVWSSNPNVIIYQNKVSSNILTNYVQAIAVNQAGDVWISMNSAGAFIWVTPKIGGNGNPGITDAPLQAGGTGNFVRNTEKWSLMYKQPDELISDIKFDANNNPWFCTANKGVAKWNGSNFQYYNTSNSLIGNNSIVSIAFKNQKTWLASFGGGLIKYKGN